jgi:hypothetical protein
MSKHGIYFLVCMTGLTCTVPAHAELGSSPTLALYSLKHAITVQTYWTRSNIPYTLYATTLDTGVMIKEYVSKSGNVFAVVWSEPKSEAAPLNLLLGAYFPCYQQAIDAAGGQRGIFANALNIEQSGLSIRVERNIDRNSARVYLRQALPVGLEEGVIN